MPVQKVVHDADERTWAPAPLPVRPPHRRDCAVGLLDKDDANRYREYAASAPARLPRKYQSALREKDATYSLVQMAKDWTFAVRIDAH